MRERIVRYYYRCMETLAGPLANGPITPNALTLFSLAVSLGVFFLYAGGFFFWAGLALLLSGLLDTLDGTVARLSGSASRFGALLDSSADRVADFLILAGLLVHYRNDVTFYAVLFVIAGSYMVSYVKARAESLGTIRVVGFMQRPERIIFLAAASLAVPVAEAWLPSISPDAPLILILWFMAVFTNLTAIHRLWSARRDLGRAEGNQ